ncbi:RING finger protein [Aspergillus lucknowensis]|uniref:RING-type domain-containing protein n=1 Tax=Aspergillus lucknowensis TaxID=176173 RepID=A0ABR4M481_9EURO
MVTQTHSPAVLQNIPWISNPGHDFRDRPHHFFPVPLLQKHATHENPIANPHQTRSFIMRRHRRRAAERHADELRCLEVNGTTRQVSVQRWLDQQQTATTTTTSEHLERYADESCPICLTSLFPLSTLSPSSGSTIQNPPDRSNNHHRPLPSLAPPEAAHISHSDQCTATITTDEDRNRPPREPTAEGRRSRAWSPGSTSGVTILNRCNHAFHTGCLASWFEYRQYRCPICADVLIFSE